MKIRRSFLFLRHDFRHRFAVTIRHFTEYAVYRLVSGLVAFVPRRVAFVFAFALSLIAGTFARRKLCDAAGRVREVFGDTLKAREVRRIVRASWRNLFFNAVEMMQARSLLSQWEKIGRIEGAPHLQSLNSGAVIAMAHLGNWELAGLAASQQGLPVFVIVRRQNNPLLDRELERARKQFGLDCIDRDRDVTAAVVRRLKEGQFLGIMSDLRARRGGVKINFLGREAMIPEGAATFARLAGVPLIPVTARREGWYRHRWTVHEPIIPDPARGRDGDAGLMQRLMDVFAATIVADPTQFFWFNSRWVLQPRKPQPPAGSSTTVD